jgi:flagellar basal-body rod protein FlgF
MVEGIYVAASGSIAQQMRMEILSNNLSNINSTGFKADNSLFRSYLPGSDADPEPRDTSGENRVGFPGMPSNFHVKFDGSRTDFSQGPLKLTGNALDLAIQGNGFFAVQGPDSVFYTRNGAFGLSPQGVLVTQDGLPVVGSGREIKIDGGEVNIDGQGNIFVDGVGVSKLTIVDFPKKDQLEKVGDSLFKPVGDDIEVNDATTFEVQQGFRELSNVNPVGMMTEMIEVLRTYESYQKAIRAIDDLNAKTIGEVGRVA